VPRGLLSSVIWIGGSYPGCIWVPKNTATPGMWSVQPMGVVEAKSLVLFPKPWLKLLHQLMGRYWWSQKTCTGVKCCSWTIHNLPGKARRLGGQKKLLTCPKGKLAAASWDPDSSMDRPQWWDQFCKVLSVAQSGLPICSWLALSPAGGKYRGQASHDRWMKILLFRVHGLGPMIGGASIFEWVGAGKLFLLPNCWATIVQTCKGDGVNADLGWVLVGR